MESHTYKIIPVKDLSDDPVYGIRYGCEDSDLEKSVQKRGVLQPLLIDGSKKIVSGHKRFRIAKKLQLKEIPVLQIQTNETLQDFFLLAVLSNWGQQFSEFEKAWILHRAAEFFKISKEGIPEEIAPAIGMAAEKHLCAHYIEVMKLDDSLLELIAKNKLPFRGAESLLKLSAADQKLFASEIAGKVSLTTNQILNLGEWVYDLLRTSKKDLDGLMELYALKEITDSEQDARNKAERLFQKIRALRFPRLSEKERQFAQLSGQISSQIGPVSFEPPPQFEGQAITLKLKVKNPQSLEDLVETLKARRKLLNSLFDIVL